MMIALIVYFFELQPKQILQATNDPLFEAVYKTFANFVFVHLFQVVCTTKVMDLAEAGFFLAGQEPTLVEDGLVASLAVHEERIVRFQFEFVASWTLKFENVDAEDSWV